MSFSFIARSVGEFPSCLLSKISAGISEEKSLNVGHFFPEMQVFFPKTWKCLHRELGPHMVGGRSCEGIWSNKAKYFTLL